MLNKFFFERKGLQIIKECVYLYRKILKDMAGKQYDFAHYFQGNDKTKKKNGEGNKSQKIVNKNNTIKNKHMNNSRTSN